MMTYQSDKKGYKGEGQHYHYYLFYGIHLTRHIYQLSTIITSNVNLLLVLASWQIPDSAQARPFPIESRNSNTSNLLTYFGILGNLVIYQLLEVSSSLY